MYQSIYICKEEDEFGEESHDTVHLWDDSEGYSSFPYSDYDYAYKPDVSGDKVSLYGQTVSKTFRYRRDDTKIMESDVPRETRVLLDRYLDDDNVSTGHKVLFFDIEVSMEEGLPSIELAKNEITAISYVDQTTSEEAVFVLDKNGEIDGFTMDNVQVYSFQTEEELLQAFLGHYEEICPTVIAGWNSDNFDVPYLYNRLNRVFGSKAGNRLSPIGRVKYNKGKSKYIIAGVFTFDYMVAYKKFRLIERPNYRLGTIGQLEVGMNKVEYEGTLDQLFKEDKKTFINYSMVDSRILAALDKELRYIELAMTICHIGHVMYEDYDRSSKFIEGTILAYLHRKGIVAPNKPAGGNEKLQEMNDTGDKGFEGAYVKFPMPGRYEWIYSLDLQSLYPSIIMSLNISPETKIGTVKNWHPEKHIRGEIDKYLIEIPGDDLEVLDKDEFKTFLDTSKFCIASNGLMYSTDHIGIIPEILDKWFAARKTFKKQMFEAEQRGDDQQKGYFDRRQHAQKILLNSVYGVLGLPIFRFYDLENAAAVTISGQDVIRTTAKYVNKEYAKLGATPHTDEWLDKYWRLGKLDAKRRKDEIPDRPNADDHCVYIDTDSVYFSSTPVMDESVSDPKQFTIDLAYRLEKELNSFYDVMAQKLFHVFKGHRFVIKGESVASAAFWVTKKRYALNKVYDLEGNSDVPEKKRLKVTGLDSVKSSFPVAFKEFMTQFLYDIMDNKGKDVVDKKLLEFEATIPTRPVEDIAKNTSVKELSKYDLSTKKDVKRISEFMPSTPAHVKAALGYNRLMPHLKVAKKYAPITDGDKIRWVYLKRNPVGLEALGFKGFDDPKQILQFVSDYVDRDKMFEKELKKKVESFYEAMEWGKIATEVNQHADNFFSF